MSQPNNELADTQPGSSALQSFAITDRGLSEKRPLNEDSFLSDIERGIFSVADGVGGAEAGEVASQTAIEVLDEAFRHRLDGADVEDLMELAIQRANASIHQMAQDHAKFSMMATTIVALHVQGNVATIGHVGDSRLYRLTPAGQLLRETADHSVVDRRGGTASAPRRPCRGGGRERLHPRPAAAAGRGGRGRAASPVPLGLAARLPQEAAHLDPLTGPGSGPARPCR